MKFILTEKQFKRIKSKLYEDDEESSLEDKVEMGSGFFLEGGEYITFKPKNYTGKRAHVLFGGSHTSDYKEDTVNMENMKKYIPILKNYASNIIIILTHHFNKFDKVKAFAKRKFDVEVDSIAGFSQGGKETWNYASDSSLHFVGLIDPSTYETDVDFGTNTYMIANPSNWGTTGFVGDARKKLEWYCKHKEDSKYSGKIECPKNVSHWEMLTYFYNKYGSSI